MFASLLFWLVTGRRLGNIKYLFLIHLETVKSLPLRPHIHIHSLYAHFTTITLRVYNIIQHSCVHKYLTIAEKLPRFRGPKLLMKLALVELLCVTHVESIPVNVVKTLSLIIGLKQ